MVTNNPGNQDSSVYLSEGSLDSLVYFALVSFLKTNLVRLPGEFITGKSRLPVMISHGNHDSPVVNTPGSRLQIHITPWKQKFEKNIEILMSNRTRSCLMKKTIVEKSRNTVPLN